MSKLLVDEIGGNAAAATTIASAKTKFKGLGLTDDELKDALGI